MLSYVDVGLEIGFKYPAANYVGVARRLESRRLFIQAVRDVELVPVESDTVQADPLLRRGKTLVTGIDMDKLQERSFYLESMEEVTFDPRDVSQLHRVYVFDPSGEKGPIMAFAHQDHAQALLWSTEWEKDHRGHVAVVWPLGAKPPVRACDL